MTDTQKAVEAIRRKYPKHSKAAYSLATRSKETGVVLTPAAKKLDAAARGIEKPADTHRLRDRASCRVSAETFERIKKAVNESGQRTVDAWLKAVITAELERGEKKNV